MRVSAKLDSPLLAPESVTTGFALDGVKVSELVEVDVSTNVIPL